MAAVYAATHRNGKRVALKMLHSEVSTNTEVRQRFIDEGYAANRVGHPGAVSVIDDDVAEDGSAFLVMDLLDGETLETRLQRRGKLWPGEVLPITGALLDVLAAAHDKGIVHRDIKPDNVFITRKGEVKLLDFGIARLIQPGRPRTTQSGATMGTPAFMPPEQARGRWDQLDGRTDLWSVGATMFLALTGQQVRIADTPNEELLLAMTQRPPSLEEVGMTFPVALVELVDRALAFEQEDRWADARAMQVAVRGVQKLLGADGSMPIATESVPPAPIDSSAPVTLLTPHPMVSSALIRKRSPVWRRKPVLVAFGAVATLVVLVLLSRRHDLQSSRQSALAPTAPVSESTPNFSDPDQPVLAEPPPSPEVTQAPSGREEPASTASPAKTRVDRPPPARPVQRPKSEAKPPSTVAPVAPTVAPIGEPPLPSSQDPLDRRR
jgi:serine/threonine-protein kinase